MPITLKQFVAKDGDALKDNNGNELLQFGVTASAQNHLKISNAASGSGPTIEAVGSIDSNINLNLSAKGAGTVNLSGSNIVVPIGTSDVGTTNGSIYYNSSSGKFRAYEGGAWGDMIGGGGGTPGGSDTNVQFNNSSAFDGDAEFTWDTSTKKLTVIGKISCQPTSGLGTSNEVFGDGAGAALSGGGSAHNTFVGKGAGATATLYRNTIIGSGADVASSGVYESTVVGASAIGYYGFSIAMGYQAKGGPSGLTIGVQSGSTQLANTDRIVIVGSGSGIGIASSQSDVLILGSYSGRSVSGSENAIVGIACGNTLSTGTNNLIAGNDADVAYSSVSDAVGLGKSVIVADDSVAVGSSASTASYFSCIVLGKSATATANYQFIAKDARTAYFGDGPEVSSSPNQVYLRGTGIAAGNTDTAGGAISLRGGNSTGTGEGGRIYFEVTLAAASTSSTQNSYSTVGYFGATDTGGGLVLGNPTGGDKGLGTLNATAVYDDNTPLTCYVLDAAIDGHVDLDYWNTFANGTLHTPAMRFTQRNMMDLSIDAFGDFWKTNRHLPAMPSRENWEQLPVGDLAQRLWETVEVQAVHIDKLNSRIKELEAKLAAN
jgi:hypothetical protein